MELFFTLFSMQNIYVNPEATMTHYHAVVCARNLTIVEPCFSPQVDCAASAKHLPRAVAQC
jgi:hypothetical protein